MPDLSGGAGTAMAAGTDDTLNSLAALLGPDIGPDIARVYDMVIHDLTLVALLLTSCLIVLNTNRDAFDLDPKRRVKMDPAGGELKYFQWKYTSGYAEACRSKLKHLVFGLRVITTFLASATILYFIVTVLAYWLDSLPPIVPGVHNVGHWWVTTVKPTTYMSLLVVGLVPIVFPLALYSVAEITFFVILARLNFDLDKKFLEDLAPGQVEGVSAAATSTPSAGPTRL